MSKIGKKPIQIPENVNVQLQGDVFIAKGPKGELKHRVPNTLNVDIDEKEIRVSLKSVGEKSKKDKRFLADWGLHAILIRNMLVGVSVGFQKVLEFKGVGYKAMVKGSSLELNLGFSHPVIYETPEGITFQVVKNTITVSGIDKGLVGRVAADIRAKKKPEPYKGSGIRYSDEIIRRKAGKRAATSG